MFRNSLQTTLTLIAFVALGALFGTGCERTPTEPGLASGEYAAANRMLEAAEALPYDPDDECKPAKKNANDEKLGPGKCVEFGDGSKLTNTGGSTIRYSTDRNCKLTGVDLRNGGQALFQGNNGNFTVTCGGSGGHLGVSGHNNTVNATMSGGSVSVTGSGNTVNNVDNGVGGTTYTGQTYPATGTTNTWTSGGEAGNHLQGTWKF